MRLAISAGHNPRRQGASYEGLTEYQEAVIWCHHINKFLEGSNVDVYEVPTGRLRDKVEFVNSLGADLAIEVHFNASVGDASGCETLHYPGSTNGMIAAQIIQDHIVGVMQNKDRGIKPGYYQMNPAKGVDYFLRATNCTSLILEPDFISKIGGYQWNRKYICRSIADGIIQYLENV